MAEKLAFPPTVQTENCNYSIQIKDIDKCEKESAQSVFCVCFSLYVLNVKVSYGLNSTNLSYRETHNNKRVVALLESAITK